MLTPRKLILLAAATLLPSTLAAQCLDNVYPAHLVDSQGAALPVEYDAVVDRDLARVPTKKVFLAFDPDIPSGTYYVHVTDLNFQAVLSGNDPLDRYVSVDNDNGTISLSLPFSANPGDAEYGIGLNGVGQSLCLGPLLDNPLTGCDYKVWLGDKLDLSFGPDNPVLIEGGLKDDGSCAVRSFTYFRVGDGTPGDVKGTVFHDLNENGVQDLGEPGLAGWTLQLVTATTSVSVQTDSDGLYCFVDVPAGDYTVELTLMSGYNPTGSTTNEVSVCPCGDSQGGDFGVIMPPVNMNCDARTIGYWRNKHGRALVLQYGILPTLPSLCIVNEAGDYVSFGSINEYRSWLQQANATNMAYMLSAQLVGMNNNVTVGYVDANCVVNDPDVGVMSITDLMAAAVASLCQHPLTLAGHPERATQEALKNALDRANNNLNWQ